MAGVAYSISLRPDWADEIIRAINNISFGPVTLTQFLDPATIRPLFEELSMELRRIRLGMMVITDDALDAADE